MEADAIITIVVIILAIFFFASEYISIDVVAIGIMVTLSITGVVSPEDSLLGFANHATLTVAAMFILSHALIKIRIIEVVSPIFKKLFKRSYALSIFSMSLSIGSLSAFVNNTPVVASFIPIVNHAARSANLSPSKYLMPLSFVAIFGGTCTLIGTSTNLLISGFANNYNIEGFSMFLMAPLGLVLFAVGTVYIMLFGKRFLKDRIDGIDVSNRKKIKHFLTEIKIIGDLETENSKIKDLFEHEDIKVIVQAVKRGRTVINSPYKDFELKKNDLLLVKGDLKKIKNLFEEDFLEITDSLKDEDFKGQETKLIEVVLLPNSNIIDKRVQDVDFLAMYQANILAIRHLGKQKFENLKNMRLKPGDILLLETNQQGYDLLKEYERNSRTPFLLIDDVEVGAIDKIKVAVVLGVIISVILFATFGLIPIVIGAFAGVVILHASKVINMTDAYRAVDWKIIFLMAGALSLGKAMTNSGVSEMIGTVAVNYVGMQFGPTGIISVINLMTSLLTNIMSNNATAALMAPIGVSIAGTLDVNPLPLLLAVAFAASSSFLTPMGYQTNTMVYSAGNYKFLDFVKFGAPLDITFWIISSLLIPFFYPL